MKTYYDSFVLCKSNHNTYIIPHTVMKSRYTNVKYHCEISWYFSVHCLPQSLRNYKEEAKIKPSEKALAMPGQSNFDIIYFCLLCHTPTTHKRIIFYINMPLLLKTSTGIDADASKGKSWPGYS